MSTPMQNTINAIKNRLPDAKIVSGDPSGDIDMECSKGYIDLSITTTGGVHCLLESGAALYISEDGTSMCLNETLRQTGYFRPCNGFQHAVDQLLACSKWIDK